MGVTTRTVTVCTCDVCQRECQPDEGRITIAVNGGDGRDVGPATINGMLTFHQPYGCDKGVVCRSCKIEWLRCYVDSHVFPAHAGMNRRTDMSVEMEMPRYVSHKQVWALKIKAIEPLGADDMFARLHFEEPRYAPIAVDADWYYGRKPEAGGYYVVYKDGYTSYSPAKAFDEGYTPENAAQASGQAPAATPAAVRGEIARKLQEQNRHIGITTARYYVDAVCNLLTRYGQPSAPTPEAKAEPVATATLTGAQLLQALDYVAPDRDADQLETEAVIAYGDGHAGKGYYCWILDCAEEGAIMLDEELPENYPFPHDPEAQPAASAEPTEQDLVILFGMWGWQTADGREFRFEHFKEMARHLIGRYAAPVAARAPAAAGDALDALIGMKRFFGKWPEFVPGDEYIDAASKAVSKMNAVIDAAMQRTSDGGGA